MGQGIVILFIFIILVFIIIHFATLTELDRETVVGIGGLIHVDGIPDLPKNVKIGMRLTKEKIIIEDRQIIPLSRINATEIIKSIDLVEKERNITGRIVLGGVLLGGIGAILGGITGLKNDVVSQDVDLMIINYDNKDGENSQIVLMSTNAMKVEQLKKFSNKINEFSNYSP